MPTRHRTIRAEDEVWDPAAKKAKEEDGLTMSELIRTLLTLYVQNGDAK